MRPRDILRLALIAQLGGSMNETAAPAKPLPKYLCHKEVRALKIKEVLRSGGKYTLTFVEEGYPPLEVTADWIDKHGPTRGGYYVLYKDNYASFSPARAFEEGYSAVQEGVTTGHGGIGVSR